MKTRLLLLMLWPVAATAKIIAIEQRPTNEPPGIAAIHGEPQQPDESLLWNLLHQQQFDELERQIAQLTVRYPNWRVPTELQRPTPTAPRAPRRKKPQVSACDLLPQRWQHAETALRQSERTTAVAEYRSIVAHCNDDALQATLQKAAFLLDDAEFDQLLNDAVLRLSFDDWTHFKRLQQKSAYQRRTDIDADLQRNFVADWGGTIDDNQDGDTAIVIAWRYFELRDFQQAKDWFERVMQWSPQSRDARLGWLLTLEQLGQADAVLTMATDDAELRTIQARAAISKGWVALDEQDWTKLEQMTGLAESLQAAANDLAELKAWSAFHREDYATSARYFDGLYQTSPNARFAEGYVLSQSRADRDTLTVRARADQAALADAYGRHEARLLYQRKQFLAAYARAPELFPQLHNIDATSVDIAGYGRHRSGEDGLGRLDMARLPVATFSTIFDKVNQIRFSVSRVSLDTAGSSLCSNPLGVLPSFFSECQANHQAWQPYDNLDNAVEFDLLYRRDGWFSPHLRIGTTPVGGAFDPRLTFDAGFLQQTHSGNWGLAVYSQPVRQSLLSYAGIHDPYRHIPSPSIRAEFARLGIAESWINESGWGNVLRSGVRAFGGVRLSDRWQAQLGTEVMRFDGRHVKTNLGVAASASVGYDFRLPGFDFFSLGPFILYEHYQRNSNFFTLGHGGYFSPNHYINPGLALNFLTDEGRDWLVRGRVGVGAQIIDEQNAPWFPRLAPSLGEFSAGSQTIPGFDTELKGVWLVTPNIQVGGGVSLRHASAFEDYAGGLFVRYFFDERKGSFSTDFPDAMFNTMHFY